MEKVAKNDGKGLLLQQENSERLQLIRSISTDRLRELVQADKEGKVLILPCKVGDRVYRIWNMPGREPVITEHVIQDRAQIIRWIPSIGRITFLTHEAAQIALNNSVQETNQKCEDLTKGGLHD